MPCMVFLCFDILKNANIHFEIENENIENKYCFLLNGIFCIFNILQSANKYIETEKQELDKFLELIIS